MFRVLGERCVLAGLCSCFLVIGAAAGEEPPRQGYVNRLTPIANPPPLLADHPEFVEPIHEMMRYEAPALAQEACANLRVRAWRFSYNARGIIEIPNALRLITRRSSSFIPGLLTMVRAGGHQSRRARRSHARRQRTASA